jgi:hypothetical protein
MRITAADDRDITTQVYTDPKNVWKAINAYEANRAAIMHWLPSKMRIYWFYDPDFTTSS